MPDSTEKILNASPSESFSERSVPGSPASPASKEGNKKNKDSSPVGSKKVSIFSSIGHKLAKSKPKPIVPDGTLAVPTVDVTTSASVEDDFVLVQHGPKVEENSGKPERDSSKPVFGWVGGTS